MKRNLFADRLSQTKVKVAGVSLNTYYCGDRISYKMYLNGRLLFVGSDYKPRVGVDWDSLEVNLDLLRFLCVGIGDVEAEYFKDYTDRQLSWAGDCFNRSNLNMWISDIDNMHDDGEDYYLEYGQLALKAFKHKMF